MNNYQFKDNIPSFISRSMQEIIGEIQTGNRYTTVGGQKFAWESQISILQNCLKGLSGSIIFEFSIPRMGKRIDVVLLIDGVIYVLEFKNGKNMFLQEYADQVWDYALDLKNFHKPSHNALIVPILIPTEAKNAELQIITTSHQDNVITPLKCNVNGIRNAIDLIRKRFCSNVTISLEEFINGQYFPTPTIIEAAVSLYHSHTVDEITRNDASAINLSKTTGEISKLIDRAKRRQEKIICFVTGVPGAGKTLVGLKIATDHLDHDKGTSSVYLSGNGPLVAILQEALARNKAMIDREMGRKSRKGETKQAIKSFIQIIHHYRDAYLNTTDVPFDHVAIFDEAQRAWDKHQTVDFMRRKKNIPDFEDSEPEFLISCLDRHKDWAVIVCLVGGGQEINIGEAGISEWLKAVENKFPNWKICISPNLIDREYNAIQIIKKLELQNLIEYLSDLHLSVSMRSFRAEKLSLLIKKLLDRDEQSAKKIFNEIKEKYPIILTRDLALAKGWVREKARGTERFGLIVSSQAQRLRPLAIDVKTPMNPIPWFLNGKDDVRSSYFLEIPATEFHIQGLEVDWACVTWDGDLRYSHGGWQTYSFKGSKWQNIKNEERKKYLINAYRVLLTRARQGMVIVVPKGDIEDNTRRPEFYDATYNYLKSIGIETL
ncbi:MAG: DUF2075 domain-containing protein [Chitinophagales bacterium]